ncbi:MAG TPA: hypothetical protein VFG68_19205 [Fimbriiglobus sp.]|nr:hypothetical protein [Fimbriiglobus sp.]
MRFTLLASCALAVATVCGPIGPASAQVSGPVGPVARPTFSPYLNLLRQDNPTYLNYYGLVRPQLDFRQSLQNLRFDLSAYQSQSQTNGQATLPGTGHRTVFMNTMGYFMTMGGGPINRQGGAYSAGGAMQPGGSPGQLPGSGVKQVPRPSTPRRR